MALSSNVPALPEAIVAKSSWLMCIPFGGRPRARDPPGLPPLFPPAGPDVGRADPVRLAAKNVKIISSLEGLIRK